MISLTSLSHHYPGGKAIAFKDWQINKAEQWLLLGESGSGKTTLLHILTGILKPEAGEVRINETSIYNLSSKKLDQFRGRNIGIIFQRPHLIKSLNISDNLVLAQSFAGLPADLNRVHEVLSSLGIAEKKEAYPNELSQGQLQRVSIARAVINKPTLIIADEPTSSLDDKNAAAVLALLLHQSDINQATLVVATHDKRVKDAFTNTYQLA
ncbi:MULTISPECIES: ABC transporter ATP-binding protein [Pedobacter]|uniref:ABC transporter related n=1 Tax=Pedobacter heparinus (strain ATCC 13125 / DSM 2366 / CIP 104194 / JCM 7457 / NBRC 12017 / NCIMB 9290 / NRRL B-14731 / HIM 762-3) TaxID=485917 RepID=C6XTM5_PEDHD|nr:MULTISPECIES: ATP-binding cassette domain-containing protein [Pedobacter]ACU03661.1 ABC transporter related [Pedobacter heparinus DSM 2366]MBB5436827.1 putative ABC transport system ATP-binding protein [Pedobacter sp. AK017]